MFSPALDLEKTAFLTIKTARTGNVSSGRLLSQDFRFFPALDPSDTDKCELSASTSLSSLSRNVSVLAIGGSFPPGAKKRISRSWKIPSRLSVILFYCAGCAAAVCAFLLARYSPRLDTLILPLLFKVSRPVLPLNTAGGRRGSFPFWLLRFPPAFAGFPARSALQAALLSFSW